MRIFVLVILLWGVSLTAHATNALSNKPLLLADIQAVSYLRDPEQSIQLRDLWPLDSNSPADQWQSLPDSHINFLYDSASYWFLFPVVTDSDSAEEWVLSMKWPFLDHVTLYLLDSQGKVVHTQVTGDQSEAYRSGDVYRLPHFYFNVAPNQQYHVILKVTTSSSVLVPIALTPAKLYQQSEQNLQVTYGLFFGALLIMAFYNSIIGIFTRDRSYAFYVAYLLSVSFYAAAITGFGQRFLWGCSPWISDQGLALSVALSFLFGAIFVDYFLRLYNHNPFAHRLVLFSVGLYSVLGIAALFAPESVVVTIEQPVGLLACLLVFVIAIYEWRKGNKVARYFMIAWIALLFGTCAYTLLLLGLIPRNPFTENIQMIGIGIEMLLLSLALADRINRSRIEQLSTMNALFETAKEKYAAEADANARGEFFAKMSHEIRTPIGGVMGIADLLRNTELDGQQRKYIDTIYDSGESLLTIVNDILDFSKMEAGKLELENIPFQLAKHARECIDIVAIKADSQRVNFKLSIANNVPEWVTGDPVRLRQILLNLLSNAVKFTYQGEIELTVVGEDKPAADNVAALRFSVRDAGIGLTKEQVARLFQPFQQADKSTTRRFGGTGLGLAICKELIELMEGDIGVDSVHGQGSCFWFQVNLAVADECEAEIPDELPRPRFSGLRVLVAEDNPVNTMVLKGLLKRLEVDAIFVENGRQALQHYENHHKNVDVIFMDCEMPEMDGFAASEAIRSLEQQQQLPAVTIIALTAHKLADFETRYPKHGMDFYLMKPATEKSLVDKLMTIFNHPN